MIRFIVDSTFGISKEYAEQENIKVVRLKMTLDDETVEEGYPETWQYFYDKIQASPNFPTSSQPSPQSFMDAIDEIYAEDANAEIFILTIAERLSGTINSAKLAASSYPGKKIVAIETGAVCACSVMMLEEMLEMAKNGVSFDEIAGKAEAIKANLEIQFIPATMEYLKRGGRVGKLSAVLLDVLKIKPIFVFKNNEISVTKKVMGIAKAISEAIAALPAKIKKVSACFIYDRTNVELLMKKLKEKFHNLKVQLFPVSPMFGVHVGIGAVGISTLAEY